MPPASAISGAAPTPASCETCPEMSAFPMLERCYAAQWRSLSASDRARLEAAWGSSTLPTAPALKIVRVCQMETPIWLVSHVIGHSMNLMSVKADFLDSDL